VIELPLKHPELFESLGIAQPKVSRQLQLCGCPAQSHDVFDLDATRIEAHMPLHHCASMWQL
jgi:hypothetical protein